MKGVRACTLVLFAAVLCSAPPTGAAADDADAPHADFAVPDRRGRFTIPDVPAGSHRVTAWHERAGDVTVTATVESGGTAELELLLPVTDTE